MIALSTLKYSLDINGSSFLDWALHIKNDFHIFNVVVLQKRVHTSM